MTPSPFSRLATAAWSGLVSIAAQTFAGAKTFTSAIIASAGVQLASLWNTNGTSASDVGVKVGVSTADGSVNSNATLFMVSTGIGGTEVQRLGVKTLGAASGFYLFGVGTAGALSINNSVGTQLLWGTNSLVIDSSNQTFSNSGVGNIFRMGGTGAISMRGTDSTGTPGAATIDKPIGKSAIAAGSSSVVINNSLATAAMHCVMTPHARDATCKELIAVCGAGSITFSGSANATAALPFSWELKGLL